MEELCLRDIQLESFKNLKKIKELCEANNIKYYLVYGTLLGAIRNNGFIPWDDDIDIAMPREDYEKFIDICIEQSDNLKPFELKHWRTCKKYIYPIARFSNSDFLVDYKGAKNYGLGTFVDIYPMDRYDKICKKSKKFKRNERKIFISGIVTPTIFDSKFKTFLFKIYFYRCKLINLNKLIKKHDKFCVKMSNENGTNIDCLNWMENINYDYEDFIEFENHIFENEQFPIPKNYDTILRKCYGDYMKLPKEEDRIPHHCYKVYKK